MTKKTLKKFSFLTLMLCHFGLLLALFFEYAGYTFYLICTTIAIIFLAIVYYKASLHSSDTGLASWFNIPFVFFGAISTYVLHTSFAWHIVLASASVGLLASFIPAINKESSFLKMIPSAVYTGTFVGMTSFLTTPSYLFITVASLITGLLLMGSKNAFYGYGGKLGSLAFGGVSLTFFIFFILFK